MATNFLTKIFGSRNDRLLKQYRKTVARINAMEPEYEKLNDEQLRAKTQEFKDRVAKGESLDALLPEAFSVVREGSKRVMKMRHFDVQLIGGMALHHGKIAEMRTGEGKTLTATLPVYLNALSGQGVHVVTVNDYLAGRDAQWMGRLYNFLGLTVGINLPQMPREEKQAAYGADITYGTNNEYGFDYLRDNMVYEVRDRVQRGLNYAIVDEVDSILIDEARTPLIISGQAEEVVQPPHPGGVAAGQVVVHRDHVHALARECVQVHRQRGGERLALAGAHLGDLAVVQRHAADELHVEVAHLHHALGALAHHGKGFGQQVVKRRTLGHALLEFLGLGPQLLVAELFVLRLHGVDTRRLLTVLLEQPVVAAAENFGEKVGGHANKSRCHRIAPAQRPKIPRKYGSSGGATARHCKLRLHREAGNQTRHFTVRPQASTARRRPRWR